jgi:hypothetical protein
VSSLILGDEYSCPTVARAKYDPPDVRFLFVIYHEKCKYNSSNTNTLHFGMTYSTIGRKQNKGQPRSAIFDASPLSNRILVIKESRTPPPGADLTEELAI